MREGNSSIIGSGRRIDSRTLVCLLYIIIGFIVVCGTETAATSKPDTRRNILMIIVDDLRPELAVYQTPDNILRFNSPNLDAFAKTATTFYRAFANYGSCNPSRNSMLTGLRPEDLRLYTKDPLSSLTQRRSWTTLPLRFRKLGYRAVGVGKIFHQERPRDFNTYIRLDNQDFDFCPGGAMECSVTDQTSLVDNTVANWGVGFLTAQNKTGINAPPFLLILGIHRPHVAYSVPTWAFGNVDRQAVADEISNSNARVWYDPNGVPASQNRPNSVNQFPAMTQRETRGRPAVGPVAVITQKTWYAAAVRWVDYCIGRILTVLDSSRLRDSTIVVILGDHGVNTGEYGDFGKSTPFETVSRVPLFIRVPWLVNTHGKSTGAVIELKDIGSTLLDLVTTPVVSSDDPAPSGRRRRLDSTIRLGDGQSQVPVLDYLNAEATWNMSQYQINTSITADFCYTCFAVTTNSRCYTGKNQVAACETLPRVGAPEDADFVVLSLRSPRHRYIEIRLNQYRNTLLPIVWNTAGLRGRVLLSHEHDDGLLTLDASVYERFNLAPCSNCQTVMTENSTFQLPSLPRDDPSGGTYFPPELDLLPPDIAMLVAQYSLVLRSLDRDKNPVCNGHGLPTVDPGVCTCFQPWLGPDCRLSAGGVFPASQTPQPTPPPTSKPTLGTNAPTPQPTTGTRSPTLQPTTGTPSPSMPTPMPTHRPTRTPTLPTPKPTRRPSAAPTFPTPMPTSSPTPMPTQPPSMPIMDGVQLYQPCQNLASGFGCAAYVLPCSASIGLDANSADRLCRSQGASLCQRWQLMVPSGSPSVNYACPGAALSPMSTWWWTATNCIYLNRNGDKRNGRVAINNDGTKVQCRLLQAKFAVQCCVKGSTG